MSLHQHFVVFYSPGTMFAESTSKPIDAWNVDQAIAMAHEITERHGATPYGFRFTTRSRADDELDSRQTAQSGTYFLGGEIFTLEQIKARNDPDDRILISNMEGNGYDRVIVNTNSWKVTQPFGKDDVLLAFTPVKKGAEA